MLNFIHANLPALGASAALVGMFGWAIYLNVAYDNEKKLEDQRRSTGLIHPTCKYHNLNKGDADTKIVDALFGVAEVVFKAMFTKPASAK